MKDNIYKIKKYLHKKLHINSKINSLNYIDKIKYYISNYVQNGGSLSELTMCITNNTGTSKIEFPIKNIESIKCNKNYFDSSMLADPSYIDTIIDIHVITKYDDVISNIGSTFISKFLNKISGKKEVVKIELIKETYLTFEPIFLLLTTSIINNLVINTHFVKLNDFFVSNYYISENNFTESAESADSTRAGEQIDYKYHLVKGENNELYQYLFLELCDGDLGSLKAELYGKYIGNLDKYTEIIIIFIWQILITYKNMLTYIPDFIHKDFHHKNLFYKKNIEKTIIYNYNEFDISIDFNIIDNINLVIGDVCGDVCSKDSGVFSVYLDIAYFIMGFISIKYLTYLIEKISSSACTDSDIIILRIFDFIFNKYDLTEFKNNKKYNFEDSINLFKSDLDIWIQTQNEIMKTTYTSEEIIDTILNIILKYFTDKPRTNIEIKIQTSK